MREIRKKIIYKIANSYGKGKTEIRYSTETKGSDDIVAVQGEIKTRWIEHCADLLSIPSEGNEEEENQSIAENRYYETTNNKS